MKESETITFEPSDPDAWICICGNMPADCGFYPCDRHGNKVEPTKKDWTTNLYVCEQCGRIIDCRTLEVAGRNLKMARRYEKHMTFRSALAQKDFEKWMSQAHRPLD